MKQMRVRRSDVTVLALMLGLATSAILPCRASAGGGTAAPEHATASSHPRAGLRRLGSAENPILLAGTETRAAVIGPVGPSDRLAIRVGSLNVSLLGVPGIVLDAGGGSDPFDDPSWAVESDVFAGGSIGVAVARSGSLYLEGGRMTLRDPVRVMGRDGSSSSYWTSTAGFEVRF
jgi:hypothetical protein